MATSVEAVTLVDDATGKQHRISAAYILDATELGDLLELAKVEHVIGAESQARNRRDARASSAPIRSISSRIRGVFVLDYLPG